ncbi:helix-turn-helix domain-containing protein [Roseibium sp. MMSF_3412]|uniref:helix-turn-helix domain-containing protein n=1 Tax=Roseibium sp. MMSF_3412 TaxID=3046712 RepID=UPI0027401A43|nr:helix-turn-helix domain-containing protein [Roseibium sp. MMSF_3412]
MTPDNMELAITPLAPTRARSQPVEELTGHIRNICGDFEIEPPDPCSGHVNGDVSIMSVSRFETAIVSLNAKRVLRDKRMIKRDPGEHLFLVIQDKGNCWIHQNDTSVHLAPGDMYLVDSAHSSEFVYNGVDARQVSIHLPRSEMLHRFGAICTGGIAIDRSDPLFVAMRAVLTKIFSDDASVAPHHGEAFLSILGAYFRSVEHQEALQDRTSKGVLSRALSLIDRHAMDPDFGPQQLAELLQVSPRTLQRQFGALGEPVGKRLLAVRLETARARLNAKCEGAGRNTIADVAYESGFNDLSHFYRTFRDRFGMPPGDLRKKVSL